MNQIYGKRNIILLSTVIIGVLWCVLMLLLADYDKAEFYFWGGLIGGILNICISVAAILMIGQRKAKSTAELSYLSLIIVSVYNIVGLVIDTIYCIIGRGDHEKVLVAINLILLALFIVAIIASFHFSERAETHAEIISGRMTPTLNYSGMLGTMLALTTDAQVKGKLLELKKAVDYGTNVSRAYEEAAEAPFYQKLTEINNLIVSNASPETIIAETDTAIRLYRSRNASMQSL